MVPTIRAPSAMTPRAETKDWSFFMGLNRPGFRGTGDMVQRRATEVNRKVLGDRQDYFVAQSGGHDGEGYREGEKWAKA